MNKERDVSGNALESRVKALEERLELLIKNLASNNRAYLDALKEIAQEIAHDKEAPTESPRAVNAVDKAEGNICPTDPPGCTPKSENEDEADK